MKDIGEQDINELMETQAAIQRELETRKRFALGQAVNQIKQIVANNHLDIEEVLNRLGAGRPVHSSDRVKPEKIIKYRHPHNPDFTWTGRGQRPAWFKAAVEGGMTLQDLLVQ